MFSVTPTDIRDVSIAIRDAVAPVFLLTGVGSILSVVVNRLSRTIDRARYLTNLNIEQKQKHKSELKIIAQRIPWMRSAVFLLIFAGFFVSLVIGAIFMSVAVHIDLADFVLISFITAMFSLILGLISFLKEIILALKEVIIET
jgi:Protein of unknown function (DUF2721)